MTLVKPHVTVNMAISADGKISSVRRETFSLGSREDRYLMDVLRARSDAVIVGARTLSLDGWAIRVRDAELRQKRRVRTGEPHPLNVVLSTRLDLKSGSQFFTHPRTKRLVMTTRAAPDKRLRSFAKTADVIVFSTKRVSPAAVLKNLSERGLKRVLIEGGGELNFSFFKANLVDEIYITVTPKILGGATAPTAVDGAGFLRDAQKQLTLKSCRRRGDEIFLRYIVTK